MFRVVMIRPGPTSARWLAAPLLAVLWGAWLRAAVEGLGGVPAHLLMMGAVLGLATAVAARRPPAPRRPGAKALVVVAPMAALLAWDPALRWLGGIWALLGQPAWRAAWAVVFLSGLASLPAVRAGIAAVRAGGPGLVAPAALGLVAGLVLPPIIGMALAGLGLAWADTVPSPHRGWAPGRPATAARAPGVALSVVAGASLVLALRAATDPTPSGLWVAAVTALLAAGPGRRMAPRSAWGGWLTGAAALALAWAARWPGLAAIDAASDLTTANAGPVDASCLLDLPLAGAGAFGGFATGLAWGRKRCPWGWAGLAIGLALALSLDHSTPLAWFAAGAGGVALVGGLRARVEAAGVGMAALGAAAALMAPEPRITDLVHGRFDHRRDEQDRQRERSERAHLRAAWAGWSAWGAGLVEGPEAAWEVHGDRDRPSRYAVRVEADGTGERTRGRAAQARVLGGHLAGLLAADRAHALVLGDDTGLVVESLAAHGFARITVAAPVAGAIRGVAGLDAAAEKAWLAPGVELVPAGPERVLRTTTRAEVVVDVAKAPWTDAFQADLVGRGPSGIGWDDHAAAVRRRLSRDGLWVVVVDLKRWPEGGPQALAARVAHAFPHVQLWLPPSGADSAVIVASPEWPPFGRLASRVAQAAEDLRALGYPSVLDLASAAVADGPACLAWADATRGAPASPFHLPAALFEKPVLHLGTLGAHFAPADHTWDLSDHTDALAALAQRLETRKHFLDLIQDAATGDLQKAYSTARKLSSEGSSVGDQVVAPLVDPHLAAARRALARAKREGATSTAWNDAQREATTAQMLAPKRPEPRVILGEIALGRHDLKAARIQFQEALALDPGNLEALWGLARTARLAGHDDEAEQYLQKAAQLHPRQWQAWHNLGLLHHELGRDDEAERDLRRAAGLAGADETTPHLALAKLYLDTDRPTRALLEAARAIDLDDDAIAWYLRGRAHYALGQYDRAEDDFRHAVLKNPNLVEARGGIGLTRIHARDWQGAADAFRSVLRLDPDNVAARENLSRVQAKLAAEQPPTDVAPARVGPPNQQP